MAQPEIETTATGDTPTDIWYIIIDSENKPFGEPLSLYVGHNVDFNVKRLLAEIMEGPYKDIFNNINPRNIEVWQCPTLSLEGRHYDDIEGLVGPLTLIKGEGSDGNRVGRWELVGGLHLQTYQPLLIKVTSISE